MLYTGRDILTDEVTTRNISIGRDVDDIKNDESFFDTFRQFRKDLAKHLDINQEGASTLKMLEDYLWIMNSRLISPLEGEAL